MGKAPAAIFVLRHGARLDAVDKHWHLTSPTPYDPPLTYGGWNQSRALGMRIAHLLDEYQRSTPGFAASPEQAVSETSSALNHLTAPRRPRKKNIIIHCSPFLRCVQTAIAVSAGLSQAHGSQLSLVSADRSIPSFDGGDVKSAGEHPVEPISTHSERNELINIPERGTGNCKLRLDAFLGEWLAPDYFEHISPPPGSVMMIASAKADLLRPAETIELTSPVETMMASGCFPGGWNRSSSDSLPKSRTAPVPAQNIAMRSRSGTINEGTGGVVASKRPLLSKLTTSLVDSSAGYSPPVPTYAVKPSDPIPHGYVAHARDASVDVDYQWDSMREPQDWGDGGEYGEEWSSMHARFRRGLEKMLTWYKSRDTLDVEDHADAADTETILVLITHGAGCNALIGTLTNRPALLDIGISSLTMAVRKEKQFDQRRVTIPQQDGSTGQGDVAEEYDMNIVASTDHLRASAGNVNSTPASPRHLSNPEYAPRHRFASLSNPLNARREFPSSDLPSRSPSYRKSLSNTSSRPMPTNRSSSGLWSSIDPAEDIVPNFGDTASLETIQPSANAVDVGQGPFRDPPTSAASRVNYGLWSRPNPAADRDTIGKRRWTVTNRYNP